MERAYCVAMVLICLNILLILVMGSLRLVAKFFIVEKFLVALALATKTMSGATLHPLVMMLVRSSWYFIVFLFQGFPSQIYHCNI